MTDYMCALRRADYDSIWVGLMQLLSMFILLKSQIYAKCVLCSLLHLEYLQTTNVHPGFNIFRYHSTSLNEEDGEVAFSMLARSIVTDPDKFEFDKVNRNFQLIQALMEVEVDMAEENYNENEIKSRNLSPASKSSHNRRKVSPKKVPEVHSKANQDKNAKKYGIRVFDYKLADFINNENELKKVEEGIQEILDSIVDGTWRVHPPKQGQYASKPNSKLLDPQKSMFPQEANQKNLLQGFEKLVNNTQRLLEVSQDPPKSVFSFLKEPASEEKTEAISKPKRRKEMPI